MGGKLGSRRGVYYGETSRSLHERAQEHLKDAEGFDAASHMVKHWMVDHPDQKELPLFKFKVVKKFKDCLSRQVAEALRIMNTKDNILNSKNEYLDNCIPRITVDESKLDRVRREREEQHRELEEMRMLEDFKLEKKNTKRQISPARNREDSRGLEIRPTLKKLRREFSKHELVEEVVVRVPEIISPAVRETRKVSLNNYHFLGESSSTETGEEGTSTRKKAEHSNNFATDEPNTVGRSQRISESVSYKEMWLPGGQDQT